MRLQRSAHFMPLFGTRGMDLIREKSTRKGFEMYHTLEGNAVVSWFARYVLLCVHTVQYGNLPLLSWVLNQTTLPKIALFFSLRYQYN